MVSLSSLSHEHRLEDVLDTVIGMIHYRKIGDPFSLAHHLVSIYAFAYVLTLNVMPYFANFRLLAELSTPLVNIR